MLVVFDLHTARDIGKCKSLIDSCQTYPDSKRFSGYYLHGNCTIFVQIFVVLRYNSCIDLSGNTIAGPQGFEYIKLYLSAMSHFSHLCEYFIYRQYAFIGLQLQQYTLYNVYLYLENTIYVCIQEKKKINK